MTEPIALLTCGPGDHGISGFGRQLARAAREHGFGGAVMHEDNSRRLLDLADRLPAGTSLAHLQANDWLFADGDHTAQDRIGQFADRLRSRGTDLSLTLHDLPQQGVTSSLFLRRARTYVALSATAVGVLVSSHHERLLLEEAAAAIGTAVLPGPAVTVIPLPVSAGGTAPISGPPSKAGTVGVLGFIYPGKGHREALEELGGLGSITLQAIGRPSDGQEYLLPELTDFAKHQGIEFVSTGYLPDDQLTARLRGVTVPIAPHPQVSASASINSWIAAGRRPLVLAGRYTCELAGRMPGSLWLYRPGELRAHVQRALEDPSLTWLSADFRPNPGMQEVALRHLAWLRATARRSDR